MPACTACALSSASNSSPNGAAVANFTVASTPRQFDRQTNEWKDGETLFMRCSVWREAAEHVSESLHRVTTDLADRRAALDALTDAVGEAAPAHTPVDDDHRGILYALGQVALFGYTGAVTLDELTDAGPRSKRTVRTKTQTLVDAGLVEIVSLRPLRFRLSTAGRKLCAIDGETV